MASILVVCAHADDMEIGLGGAVCRHVGNGHEVNLCVVTDGGRTAVADDRQKEQASSAQLLGINDVIYLNKRGDTGSTQSPDLCAALMKLAAKYDPLAAYIHYPDDTHQEHRAAAMSGLAAFRNVPNVLMFESVTSLNFQPSFYGPLSLETYSKKMKALACHVSQVSRWGKGRKSLPEVVEAMTRWRGSQVGEEWAEAFAVHRLTHEVY